MRHNARTIVICEQVEDQCWKYEKLHLERIKVNLSKSWSSACVFVPNGMNVSLLFHQLFSNQKFIWGCYYNWIFIRVFASSVRRNVSLFFHKLFSNQKFIWGCRWNWSFIRVFTFQNFYQSTIPSTSDYFQLRSNRKYISRKSVEIAILEFFSRTEADGIFCIIYGSKGVG